MLCWPCPKTARSGVFGMSTDRAAAGGRLHRVETRWSEDELAQLVRVETRHGLSRSATVRAAVDLLDVESSRQRAPSLPATMTEKDLIASRARRTVALNKVGNLVNQVAVVLRSGTAGQDGDAELIMGVYEALSEAVEAEP